MGVIDKGRMMSELMNDSEAPLSHNVQRHSEILSLRVELVMGWGWPDKKDTEIHDGGGFEDERELTTGDGGEEGLTTGT